MIEPNSELVIDYELVRNNIQAIKGILPTNCKIMGIIKSNAYGHDLEKSCQALDDFLDGYGVVRLEEALKIREKSLKPVLAMQGVYSSDAYNILKKITYGLLCIQSRNYHWQSNFKMICYFG